MILAVTHGSDEHAPPLLAALAARGERCARFDAASFPRRAALRMRQGADGAEAVLQVEGEPPVTAAEVRAVWWRRVRMPELHPEISDPAHRQFAWDECEHALGAFWLALAGARWVNPLGADRDAHRKPHQLATARAAGLEVPRTLVTNDPDAARAFVEELGGPGRVLYKPFTGSAELWREARLLRPEELALLPALRYAPVIFQEYVPGLDLRATVVGERVFTCRIDARETAYPVDWRLDPERARFEAVGLPAAVERRLLALHRTLGLRYGAADLRETPDGRAVFLEVNPGGQWLFVERRTGLQLTDALAGLLAGG
ncbi:MvdC/MvdD family ATP grasp protein [Anaeromyxobacter diazotrophicus]|uniref:ATP-grasp ribosomal peptide maturase n=1 Tax=Anaeromyxobacter diazotrophicus TaxID=2590199 RepID=A0A7I9VRZ9_9BACT|nr:alpha-L-glutamate ligase [Anaeromyxobacter diazotrophicus]GEJ58697.1 ATP-grasp ribosomal peptide maturase [Anaeromyxobacter diazotrophicus]